MNSLRVRLALWVLLPFSIALALNIWFSYQDSQQDAQRQQDHLLWTSAHIIAGQMQWKDGELTASIPPVALEVFSSVSHDEVYFSVTTRDGRLLAGWPDLPVSFTPTADLPTNFEDMTYQGQLLRAYTMTRDFFNSGQSEQAIITVAKTERERVQNAHTLWWPNLIREAGLLILVLVLMLSGLRHELKPLATLQGEILNRERTDLHPISLQDLPLELRPVVDTINQYGRRIQSHIDSRKRFIEDAAHQLRTPMALLSTQLHYAAGLANTPELKKTLSALSENRQRITQLVNQLLSLSQAENYRPEQILPQQLDLNAVVRDVLVELAPLAASRDIDLGIGPGCESAELRAPRPLLYALLFNLVDNAIRYTPEGGIATVSVIKIAKGQIQLEVIDSGPGIAPELRTRVFERFNRGNTTVQGGTGLGLAIVKETASACGASIKLQPGPMGKGLRAIVQFKLDPATISQSDRRH